MSDEQEPVDVKSHIEKLEARGDKVTDRRFKRYHRVAAKRRADAKADDAFFKAVFSLAGVATAFVFVLIWVAMNGGGGLIALAPLSEPWLGPFSKLELFGFSVIAFLAALYFWRIRRKR
ncbi:MAG: hypothetical protein ABJ275_10150 [Maricaulaceae bacterium]